MLHPELIDGSLNPFNCKIFTLAVTLGDLLYVIGIQVGTRYDAHPAVVTDEGLKTCDNSQQDSTREVAGSAIVSVRLVEARNKEVGGDVRIVAPVGSPQRKVP